MEKNVVIPYKMIRSHQFMMAVQRLANLSLSMKAAYRLKKTLDKVDQGTKTIQKEYREEFMKKFYKLDDKGSPVKIPVDKITDPSQDPFERLDGVTDEQLEAGEKEFSDKKLTVDVYQVPAWIFADTKFTATDVMALEGIVDFDAEEEKSSPALEEAIKAAEAHLNKASA